jgi:hypothetical protein
VEILAAVAGLAAAAVIAAVVNVLVGDPTTRLLRALLKTIPWPGHRSLTQPDEQATRLHRDREDVERALLREKEDLEAKLKRVEDALGKVRAPLGRRTQGREG